jgi:hypothetical protein
MCVLREWVLVQAPAAARQQYLVREANRACSWRLSTSTRDAIPVHLILSGRRLLLATSRPARRMRRA